MTPADLAELWVEGSFRGRTIISRERLGQRACCSGPATLAVKVSWLLIVFQQKRGATTFEVEGNDRKRVMSTRGHHSIVGTERQALDAAQLVGVSLEFVAQLSFVYVPNRNRAFLPTCSQQNVAVWRIAPLNRVDHFAEVLENMCWPWKFSFPETNFIVRAATSKQSPTRIPLNLFHFI